MPNKQITLCSPCTIRAAAQAAAGQEQAPGTIDMLAYTGGLLEIEGWDYPLVCAVEGIRPAAELIPARIGHGQDETDVLGQIAVSIDLAAQTVRAAGTVTNYESPQAKSVISMARRGHQFQASIGGTPRRYDFIQRGQTVPINGRTFEGPVYAVYETELGEISVVSLGADTTTRSTIAAAAAKGRSLMADTATTQEKPAFSEFCAKLGFDAATLTDEQKSHLGDLHAKLSAASDDTPPPADPPAKKKDGDEPPDAEA